MAFNGTEGNPITLAQGQDLTARYRNECGGIQAVFIGAEHINDLLAQTGAMGIRVYFGRDTDDTNTTVLVAADSSEDDILDLIIDCGKKCPIHCGSKNDLNS